ncbi:MAG: chromate transporter [Oscillospiraceae bacterium]|nr:chromate transporter [Oscillospiraceae bacterium]
MEVISDLLSLFFTFAKIGLFTVGGGYAMIPLMQKELVQAGLMTEPEVLDMIAVSQVTPGAFSVNAATFAGMRLHGAAGASVATAGVLFPSLIITLLAAKFFFTFRRNIFFRETMHAVRPVALALIFYSALTLLCDVVFMKSTSGVSLDWMALILGGAAFVFLQSMRKISPALLLIICGMVGVAVELFLSGR